MKERMRPSGPGGGARLGGAHTRALFLTVEKGKRAVTAGRLCVDPGLKKKIKVRNTRDQTEVTLLEGSKIEILSRCTQCGRKNRF